MNDYPTYDHQCNLLVLQEKASAIIYYHVDYIDMSLPSVNFW
jgi:hypothetical protein